MMDDEQAPAAPGDQLAVATIDDDLQEAAITVDSEDDHPARGEGVGADGEDDDDGDEFFSHIWSQMQHTGGYDVWMNKDNAQLVAVPPLHRVVSKGSTHLLKQCVCTVQTLLWPQSVY